MDIPKQIGGKGKSIPAFIEPLNTPYLTNNQKEILQKTFEKPVEKPFEKTFEKPFEKDFQQSFKDTPNYANYPTNKDSTKNYKKQIPSEKMEMPIEPIALTTPFIPPQFQSYMSNFMKNFYTPFIYKDYHINIGGPNANHIQASMVYEDALPPPSIFTSYKTLKERNSLVNYIRGTFISIQEGENIDFNGGPNSLNSRLKLIELNPYNTNYFSSNPYKGLPESMLIYRSCYPITYNKQEAAVQCQKSSIGINMRVYRLSIDEYNIFKPIIPQAVEPNTNPTATSNTIAVNNAFNNTNNTNTNNNNTIPQALELIQRMSNSTIKLPLLQVINPLINKKKIDYDIWREVEYYAYIRNTINKDFVSPNFIQSYCYFMNNDSKLDYGKNTMKLDNKSGQIVKYSDKSLILLTESPNNNIFVWASNLYIKERNIQKQIYTGYKSDDTWKSVIMQMVVVFYVMTEYKFTFNDMSLQGNIYIKDIDVDTTKFWRYKIKDIDYYVPNYGSLLLLDSDYHDLNNKKKIIGKFLEDDDKIIKEQIKANAIKCFSPNNFGQEFTDQGGVKPSDNIIRLLTTISDLIRNDTSFDQIIQNTFTEYVHNRVGTLIRTTEFPYIRKNDIKPFRKGELIIYESKFENYEILLFIKNIDEYKSECIVKVNDQLIPKELPKDLLCHYSDHETIRQDVRPNEPSLTLDYIIETYNL